MMALFGAPVAIEDAPRKACRAALEIQSAMYMRDAQIEARLSVRTEFRIGIYTGPIVVGRVGQRCFEGGLSLLLFIAEFAFGVSRVVNGDIAGGVRWIEEWRRRFAAWGFYCGPAFYDLYAGEVYLQMAISENKPPLGAMLKNFWFLLPTLPFAASKARRHLESAAAFFADHDMPASPRPIRTCGRLWSQWTHSVAGM